ncbi:MAG TPA: AraC family transcriptional regulator [Thermoanaerobaculia bacterium]
MPRWFAAVREYVHAHAGGRVTLEELAAVAGVHPASVVRAFRTHLGSSPGDYVRRLRIEHACRALKSTRRPIAEIALDAGFFDQSHFTAAFRRYVGVTPARYRGMR